MVRINQLSHPPETGIYKERIRPSQSGIPELMNLISVIKPFSSERKREVKVKFITRTIIIIHIDGNRNPVDVSGQLLVNEAVGGCTGIYFLWRIYQSDCHFTQSVTVFIVEKKWIFPVQPYILHIVSSGMNLKKS